MGLETVTEGGLSASEKESTTVSDLESEYGEEAVRRGLKYMKSLSDAEQNYRDAASAEHYKERMKDNYGVDELSEDAEEASHNWESNMQNGGLGLSGEEEDE